MKILSKKLVLIFFAIIVIIGLIVLVLSNKTTDPKVINSNPVDKSEDIPQSIQPVISFDKKIPEVDKKNISLEINPSLDYETIWVDQIVKIVPKKKLNTNTTYGVNILYKSKSIYTFSFTTFPYTDKQLLKEGSQQTKDDKAFGDAYTTFFNTFAWNSSLPIETDKYTVVYDFTQKSFRIRYKQVFSTNQKKTYIQEVLDDLKAIGVPDPINYYEIDFVPIPSSSTQP